MPQRAMLLNKLAEHIPEDYVPPKKLIAYLLVPQVGPPLRAAGVAHGTG